MQNIVRSGATTKSVYDLSSTRNADRKVAEYMKGNIGLINLRFALILFLAELFQITRTNSKTKRR